MKKLLFLNNETGKLFNICFNYRRTVGNIEIIVCRNVGYNWGIRAFGDGCHVRPKII